MLAKGPAPLPLIVPALFFYFAVFRKWKLIPKLLPIAGVILFLLIISALADSCFDKAAAGSGCLEE